MNLHIIDINKELIIAKVSSDGVPRVGEEIRLLQDKIYAVKHVVWCFDEGFTFNGTRVNIGVEEV